MLIGFSTPPFAWKCIHSNFDTFVARTVCPVLLEGPRTRREGLGTHEARFSDVIYSPSKKNHAETELTVVHEIN